MEPLGNKAESNREAQVLVADSDVGSHPEIAPIADQGASVSSSSSEGPWIIDSEMQMHLHRRSDCALCILHSVVAPE